MQNNMRNANIQLCRWSFRGPTFYCVIKYTKTFIIILSRQQVNSAVPCNIKEQVISIFE